MVRSVDVTKLVRFNRRVVWFFVYVLLVCGVCGIIRDNVYGDEGGGSDSGGVSASCRNHAFTLRCPTEIDYRGWEVNGDGSKGGGASWRIFKTNDASGLDSWTGYGGNILQESYKSEAINTCKNVGWFASFGWDGMYDSHNGYSNFNYQIGPANRNSGNMIRSAYYNSYNAKDMNYLTTNNFPNNTKIYESTALALYRKLHPEATAIPDGVGYFCVAANKILTVQNRNIYDGSNIGNSYTADTGYNEWKSIERQSLSGYKFIGWKTVYSADDADAGHKTGTTGIMERTNNNNPDGDPYPTYLDASSIVSDSGVVYYKGNTSKRIYTKIMNYFNNNRTLYAYYAPACKLSISQGTGTTISVNRTGGYYAIRTGLSNNDNIYRDDVLKVDFGLNPGYTWVSHQVAGRNFNSGSTYTVSGTNNSNCSNVSVAATAVRDEFEGQVRVSEVSATWEDIPDSKKATTGWSNVNGTKAVHNIQNCDPVNGCTVRFAHWLRRTAGGGSTDYSVTRTSNYYSISSGTIIATTTEDFSDPTTASGNKRVRLEDFTNKLYPGQAVCETLTFRANVSVGNVSITACALALGDAQPSNPDGSSTLLDIEVSKDGGSTYQKEVYAKPEDYLKFKATYNPVLQYTYRIIPERMQINSGTIYPSSGRNVARYLGMNTASLTSMFNLYKGSSLKNWNNDFSVYSTSFLSELGASNEFFRNYNVGNGVSTRQEQTNDHNVSTKEVGKVLRETAVTNLNDETKTTPSQVSFSNNGGYNLGNVITAQIEKIALARIPYNFSNSTEITGLKSGRSVLYAGESDTIQYNAIVGTRRNDRTDGTYATIVRKAKLQILACEGSCNNAGSTKYYTNVVNNVTLNSSGNLSGYTDPKEMSVNIPDLPAGSTMCFKSRVYPASVKNDITVETEWADKEEGYAWVESVEQCYDVAKKPSLQVWGGSVYSAGSITLNQSVKNNLAGYGSGTLYDYNVSTAGDKRVFGTWTELGLVAGGTVRGFSSGAGWGYASTDDAVSAKSGGVSELGGRGDTDFCKASTLSFANASCNVGTGSVGGLGASSLQSDSSNKSGLISRFVGEDDEYERVNGFSGNISEIPGWKITDNEIRFSAVNVVDEEDKEVLDEAGKVKKMATRVIDAGSNDIVIDKNIVYEGNYSSLADVPKVIIYAENIKINCNVMRIDAVLIANKDIDTCGNGGKENSEARSRQLIINGSVITNTFTLGRTYGAATGKNSIVPAEIVNYDSSLYLWANRQASTTRSGDLTESYITELAPRY